MSPAQWLYHSLALFFLPYYLDQRFLHGLWKNYLTNHKTQISQRTRGWKCCGNEVIVWRGMVSTSQGILRQMLDNVGNITVMVTTLSKTNIVTMLSLFHPTLAQYLTITVSVLPDLYSCSRTKQRKEQLSQEKAATILESAMLVNTPKPLKTCLISHWTRWKVYFQKPTQLRWLRAKFNKNFQISFCKILKNK